jgi:hypothetical protein
MKRNYQTAGRRVRVWLTAIPIGTSGRGQSTNSPKHRRASQRSKHFVSNVETVSSVTSERRQLTL